MENDLVWSPTPKQAIALARPETEILYGGARGGGKTDCGIAWLLKARDIPTARALVLRIQAQDLKDWCDRAERLYNLFGAKRRGRPSEFVFPSGYTVWTGHLQDDASWQAYQGFEIQLLLIEELTQIPNLQRFLDLRGSIRSTIAGLDAQCFLTANPGGPGHAWVKDRFINAVDFRGRKAIPGRPIIMDPDGKQSRIFIPSTVEDNPHLLEKDPGYIEYLNTLPTAQRKAWRFGDWDAYEGAYFSEFRKERLDGEPLEALHVIDPIEIPAFCPRWIGMDWAYRHESAVYWLARHEDSRIHVYREFVVRNLAPEEFGVKLAEMSLADIDGLPDKSMPMYLSPDAFAKRDGRMSIALQMEEGMKMVLGQDAVFLADFNEEESEVKSKDPARALEMLAERQRSQRGSTRIVIERANNDRIAGWNYLRTLMRWWPLMKRRGEDVPDMDVIRTLLAAPNGTQRFAEYINRFDALHGEVLPRLLIHRGACPLLPNAILAAQFSRQNPEDVQKTEGDDMIDALRYGVMGHRKRDVVLPSEVAASRLVESRARGLLSLSEQSKYMMDLKARLDIGSSSIVGVTPRRSFERGRRK